MDVIQINSGEYIGMRILTIRSIPHISTLSDNNRQQKHIEHYAQDMANLLNEVYQQYKELFKQSGQNTDIALELSWVNEAVVNQPYKAKIHLFLILRSIHRKQEQADKTLQVLLGLMKATLDSGRYEYDECSFADYYGIFKAATGGGVQAIVKEERLEDLQNSYMPACYAYDKLPTDYQDLSRIANILIMHPGCAVSFQLIPTYYNNEELTELNRLNQSVNMLSQGISDRQVGNVSFTNAERVSLLYKYYSDNKNRPLFQYNIIIYGGMQSLSAVATRVLGQLNSTQQEAPNLQIVNLPCEEVCSSQEMLYPQPWVVSDMLLRGSNRNTSIWSSGYVSNALYRFPFIVTAEEAASFFRLPIGDDKVNAGLNVNETEKTSKTYSQNLINAGDIEIGKLKSSSANSIGFTLKDLAKHMLVVGTPGSGKTTFSVGLLDRLWKDHHIPFLVIEPAKNEYRALVQSIPELQVFTPGKNFISPFVFNPFVPPKNVRLETYKSTLKTAFAAGVSMSTPLDKIFEDTINNCYSDFRWLDSYTTDNKGKTFNITDFIKCFQDTFDEIGYTGDAKNIGRAGIVRLKSLVNLFDNYYSIPIEDILSKPTIIELAAIENSEQKALIIALLLLSILAYVNANYIGEGGLRNFILLEEAHVLLDADTNVGEGSANPSAIAQGLVKRMLAEIRSYGVGIAIADQSPRKVGIDIVALTDIKVAFRLVEGQDKEILANSTSMNEVQASRLAKLKPGEAFLFFNRLDEPEEIITPDYRLDNQISISLSDDGIKQLTTYWNDKQEKLRPYPECAFAPCCQKCCNYDRRLLAREVARRIFREYVGTNTKDPEPVKKTFSKFTSLIKAELNDEPFSPELRSCVKVHFWRKLKYDTMLRMREADIKSSIERDYQ
ncbi:MAG: ATP-binding protein [Prevotella sp.]|nr:ATP-binding protein [Prevotella sp.]MBR1839909.1 ATP-binding protein [Prevotella sp.]